MEYIKKNTRMRTNSNFKDDKPLFTNDSRSSYFLKNIPKISLKKKKNNINSIERNEKFKIINKINLTNSTSLEESNRNLSSSNAQQLTSKKTNTINLLSPIDNHKKDKLPVFIHMNNHVNKDIKNKNTPLSYCNKIVNFFNDNEKIINTDNKNNQQHNKINNKTFFESKNSNPKNFTKKRIDINLPNPRNKYKLLNSSNIKINNSIGDEQFINQIKEIPTMMINNRIKLNNEEKTNNSESFKNSMLQNENINWKPTKKKILPGKTGFMRNNKIYVTKQNKKNSIKSNNDNELLMSNDSIFKNNVMNIENNANLVCISLDAKKNNINTSNSIEVNKEHDNVLLKQKNFNVGNNKSITFGSENKKTQERNTKFGLIIKKRHKKNMKMKLFLTNKNKKVEDAKIENIITNIEENNYFEKSRKENKAPQTITKSELEKKMKNSKDEPRKKNNAYVNKTHKIKKNRNYNLENNLTNHTIKSIKEEEKTTDEREENHEDNDTFDNSTQLSQIYNHPSIKYNLQTPKNNFLFAKNFLNNELLKLVSTQYHLVEKIINYLDYKSLNNICLINKNYYNILKPIIYQKIYKKISNLNKKYTKIYKTEIKKSVLKISQLSEMPNMVLQKKYMDFLYENNCKYDVEIKKDLTRTSPENASFKYGNKNYNKLYHILTAYSNYNKNIGYAQGLNFIAAKCIYVFENEIEVFIFFDALIQKFNLVSLLGVNNNLKIKLKEINFFLKEHTPKINAYLENFNLNYDFFTANWVLTLFSNSMDNDFLFYVWDFMIVFGWKFFKCFVVAVVKTFENDILKQSQNNLTNFMRNILRDNKFKENFESIISLAFKYMTKENKII